MCGDLNNFLDHFSCIWTWKTSLQNLLVGTTFLSSRRSACLAGTSCCFMSLLMHCCYSQHPAFKINFSSVTLTPTHWLPMCWFLDCVQPSVSLYISSSIVSLFWLKKKNFFSFFLSINLGFSALSSPLSSSHFFWNGITVPSFTSHSG